MSTLRPTPPSRRPTPQKSPSPTTVPASVLSALRATQITSSKTLLPAELLALVLDHLPPPALIRVARTSRRMREMVYDDARWVSFLRAMRCWNEAEARQRADAALQRRRTAGGVNGVGTPVPGPGGGMAGRKSSTVMFDATAGEGGTASAMGAEQAGLAAQQLVGSAQGSGLGASATGAGTGSRQKNPLDAVKVLARVKSIRGFARQEFGKVYGALGPYYLDLVSDSRSHADARLFKDFTSPEHQAHMLMQLERFGRSDWAVGGTGRRDRLDIMLGGFEAAAMRELVGGMQGAEWEGRVRRYAIVLVVLNGGKGAVETFVRENQAVRSGRRLGDPRECIKGGPYGGSGLIALEPAAEFLRRLAMELNEQARIAERVFPHGVEVLVPLTERVAKDIIEGYYLEILLDESRRRGKDLYLKAVSGLFEQCMRFAMSIKPIKGSKPDLNQEIARIICACFEKHVDLYLQEEASFFQRRSESKVEAWEKRLQEEEESTESFYMSNLNRHAAKQDFLSSFKKVIMLPVNVVSMPFAASKSSSKTSTGIPDLGGPGNRSSTPVPIDRVRSTLGEAPDTELAAKAAIINTRLEGIKSLFSIEVALDLIHAAKESLERTAVFVRMDDPSGRAAKEQCEAIFVTLVQILGTRHIKTGFDKAVTHLSEYSPRDISNSSGSEAGSGATQRRVTPLVTFLELVNVGDLIQQMLDVFYAQELVAARLADKDDFLSPAGKEKRRFEQMLDERVAAGLNKGIDVLMEEVEYLCATVQTPSDFNPPEGQIAADVGPSGAARRVVSLVEEHVSMLVGSTEKSVLDVFNQEVGLRLFTVVCKHLKRQRISIPGAIKLISDTNHYHAYIQTLKNKMLTEYFNALRELSQIYLIAPGDAREIGVILADSDRYRGIFTVEEKIEFAERRVDWFSIRKDVEKAMYGMGCAVM